MVVCLCKGVSHREVEAACADGAETLDDLANACGAGTDCGSCHEQLAEILHGSGPTCAMMPEGARRHALPVLGSADFVAG